LAIICILPFTSATLVCPTSDLNESSQIVYCYYTSSASGLLSPKVFNNDGLVYDFNYVPQKTYANSKYFFKIYIDVFASTKGTHNITITQGTEKIVHKVNLEIQEINHSLSLTYPTTTEQTVNANLTLINNTKKNYPVILKATFIPTGISVDKINQVIILKPNETKIIPLEINYKNNDSNKLEYTLAYSNKKEIIQINLERDKMPTLQKNNLTAFFTLANTNSKTIFVVIDVILFVACIVLFTMFIGRLGKYIVRKP
jgi:hypothetical protein